MAEATSEIVRNTLSVDFRQGRRDANAWWRVILRDKAAIVAGFVLLMLVAGSVLAPVLSPYDPNMAGVAPALQSPSSAHLFGTDGIGRDLLSRVLWGGRISIAIGFVAVALGLAVGGTIGLLAGYFRVLDGILMRIIDVMLAVPGILLALGIVASLGAGLNQIVVAIGVGSIPTFARLTRSTILSSNEEVYVEAAHAIGAGHLRIMFRHLLPNSFAPILVYGTLRLAGAVLAASYLSFLGFGPQPPTAEWGVMVNAGRQYLIQSPHIILFPSLCLVLLVLSFNILGDSFRDALDPQLRRRG